MSEPLLPRHNRDRQELKRRLEQAADKMRRDEARVRWSALGFALALGVLSGCAPTAVYGGPPPPSPIPSASASAPMPTPSPSASPQPTGKEPPMNEVYGVPRPPQGSQPLQGPQNR